MMRKEEDGWFLLCFNLQVRKCLSLVYAALKHENLMLIFCETIFIEHVYAHYHLFNTYHLFYLSSRHNILSIISNTFFSFISFFQQNIFHIHLPQPKQHGLISWRRGKKLKLTLMEN